MRIEARRAQLAPEKCGVSGPWRGRVEAADRDGIAAELDELGRALTGPLVTAQEATRLAALYADDSRFRSTIEMNRYRFGAGQYRHFQDPLPDAVTELKAALYPRLLPIARDWWTRLRREPSWPDDLTDWLTMCHDAGQTKPTPLLLRYGPGDWNALRAG